MAEVPFRPARQLSEYKGKGASASRECKKSRLISDIKFKVISRKDRTFRKIQPKGKKTTKRLKLVVGHH